VPLPGREGADEQPDEQDHPDQAHGHLRFRAQEDSKAPATFQ
jgi:hypothetical protein